MAVACFSFCLTIPVFCAENDIKLDDLPGSLFWDATGNLRTGVGYKDNLLLSDISPEESGFFRTEAEVMLLRLPLDGHEFFFLGYGEDIRYFSGDEVDSEQVAFGLARYLRQLGQNWKVGTSLQYMFQDQVFDASLTETNRSSVQARGHSFRVTPAARLDMKGRTWVELEAIAGRQLFAEPLDDYWEPGARLTGGKQYGHKSEVSLSYEITRRRYDVRVPYTASGIPEEGGGDLSYLQQEAALRLRHNWDKAKRWQTTSKLSYYHSADNGSGYFDYHRYQVSQQARRQEEKWQVTGQARLSYYDYPVQTVSPDDGSLRYRLSLVMELRGEVKLTKHFKVFGQYENESNWANTSYDQYNVNVVCGGIDFEW